MTLSRTCWVRDAVVVSMMTAGMECLREMQRMLRPRGNPFLVHGQDEVVGFAGNPSLLWMVAGGYDDVW